MTQKVSLLFCDWTDFHLSVQERDNQRLIFACETDAGETISVDMSLDDVQSLTLSLLQWTSKAQKEKTKRGKTK
jgi:hypothetical protein